MDVGNQAKRKGDGRIEGEWRPKRPNVQVSHLTEGVLSLKSYPISKTDLPTQAMSRQDGSAKTEQKPGFDHLVKPDKSTLPNLRPEHQPVVNSLRLSILAGRQLSA